MKKYFFLFLFVSNIVYAQVAVNNSGASCNSSAILDVASTDKGFLVPRLTTQQRTNLTTIAANGLLVYDTQTESFWYYKASTGSWHYLKHDYSLEDADGDTKVQFEKNGDDDEIHFVTSGTEYFRMSGAVFGIYNNGQSVFLGDRAGELDDLTDNGNVFIGADAGMSNTTGWGNVGVGFSALALNSTGSGSLAIGSMALSSSTGGSNTAIGSYALSNCTTATGNCAVGTSTLKNNMADGNTAIGSSALIYNTTGEYNVVLGSYSLLNDTTSNNVVIGYDVLAQDTAGGENTCIGVSCLPASKSGNSNVAIGNDILKQSTTNRHNVIIGHHAQEKADSSINNVAIGPDAMGANKGEGNTVLGPSALYGLSSSNNISNYNVAIGSAALNRADRYTEYSTVFGYSAMAHDCSGYSTVIGYRSAYEDVNADYVTAIGSNTTFIYHSTSDNTNRTVIGYNVSSSDGNQIVFGSTSVTSIGGYAAWSNLSDKRFKKNIRENVIGLEFITKLNPVTYHLDIHKLNKFHNDTIELELEEAILQQEAIVQSGFIAQEVEQAASDVGYNFSGIDKPKTQNDNYSLRYEVFVVPIVKAVQEQQQMLDEQLEKINLIKDKLEIIKKIKSEIKR